MSREKVEERETSGDVPGYIVTFSDMVTLLLTFFVMLLSLAEVQDPELFNKGRDSFIEATSYGGLGMFMSGYKSPGLQAPQERHETSAEEDAPRTVDAKRENRRRAFTRLEDAMDTMPSQIVGEQVDFTVLPVAFAPGESRLNAEARETAWQFARNLPESAREVAGTLYVLGLAEPGATSQDRWVLSAQRAQVVADLIRQALPDTQWQIVSWGAGAGHDWAGRDGDAANHAQIMVGVVKNTP